MIDSSAGTKAAEDTRRMADKTESVASIRADFMRRWFAIAVSVGFATTVVNMGWVKNGVWPTYAESEQIARLSVALLATLFSWEGYLLSIQRKPLDDIFRFLVDVFLVFVYLFMLLTSKFPFFWLALHAITFGIYVFWDILTIGMYRNKFVTQDVTDPNVLMVYCKGLIGSEGIDRGPIITVFWLGYFCFILWASRFAVPYSTFWFAALVLLGLAGYRIDKTHFRKSPLFAPLATLGLAAFAGILIVILKNYWAV